MPTPRKTKSKKPTGRKSATPKSPVKCEPTHAGVAVVMMRLADTIEAIEQDVLDSTDGGLGRYLTAETRHEIGVALDRLWHEVTTNRPKWPLVTDLN